MNKLFMYFLLTELLTGDDSTVNLTVLCSEYYLKIFGLNPTYRRFLNLWVDLTNEIDKSLIPSEYLDEIKT